MKKRFITAIAVLMVIAALFVGCDNSAEIKSGRLVAKVTEPNMSKTIAPEDRIVDIVSYRISGEKVDSSAAFSETFTGKSITIEDLEVGKWRVTVEGLNVEGTVIAKSPNPADLGNVEIKSSKDAPVVFNLNYIEGEGTFVINVSVPSDESVVNSIVVELSNHTTESDKSFTGYVSSASEADGKKIVTFDETVPTGNYSLSISLKDVSGEVKSKYIESLHIYDGTTSTFSISWASGKFMKTAAPIFSLDSGKYQDGTALTMVSEADAKIYYTLDGTTPDVNSPEYTGEIILDKNMTVKAFAVKEGLAKSEVTTKKYEVQVIKPVIVGGSKTGLTDEIAVEITCATEGSSIYYTLDGSIPSKTNGELYSSAIVIDSPTTISAIAVKENLVDSSVASARYEYSIQDGHFEVIDPKEYKLNVTSPSNWNPGSIMYCGTTYQFSASVSPSNASAEIYWYLDGELVETGNSVTIGPDSNKVEPGAHILTVRAELEGYSYTENLMVDFE